MNMKTMLSVVFVAFAACTGTAHVAHEAAPRRYPVVEQAPIPVDRERESAAEAPPTPAPQEIGTPVVVWNPMNFTEPVQQPPAEPEYIAATPSTPAVDGDTGTQVQSPRRHRGGYYGPSWYVQPYPYYWTVPTVIGVHAGIHAAATVHREMFHALNHGSAHVLRRLLFPFH